MKKISFVWLTVMTLLLMGTVVPADENDQAWSVECELEAGEPDLDVPDEEYVELIASDEADYIETEEESSEDWEESSEIEWESYVESSEELFEGEDYLLSNPKSNEGNDAAESYTITCVVHEHGTVKAILTNDSSEDPVPQTSAAPGTLLKVVPVADSGYHFTSFVVKDGSDNSVPLNAGSFNMPSSNVTISAAFIPEWEYLQRRIDQTASPISGTSMYEILVLDQDYTAPANDQPLEIPEGKKVDLRLNGHTISRGLSSPADNGNVFTVRGSISISGAGTITGGNNTGAGGGIIIDGGSCYLMKSAVISGNASGLYGGGVCVKSGSFYLEGGEISTNSAPSGGGVFAYSGKVEIRSGTIKENTAAGASPNAPSGGGVFVFSDASFAMTGGTITGNNAVDGKGGGVYLYGPGMFSQSIGIFRKSHNLAFSHEWHRYQSYWLHYFLSEHYNDITTVAQVCMRVLYFT